MSGSPANRPSDAIAILHAPCHAPSLDLGAVRLATSLNPDSIGWSEAYERIPLLRSRLRYKVRVGRSSTDPRRGARDVPIMRRRSRREVDWWAVKACDASEPIRIAPERWITGVAYETGFGVVEHITIHPHAAVQGRDRDLDRVQKYAQSMRRLEARMIRARRKGHHVVVTGDLQWHGYLGPAWSPGRIFERHDMQSWNLGIDWLAVSGHLRTVPRSLRVLGPEETGQDHPWMFARFRA